jgi:hypothetical protein
VALEKQTMGLFRTIPHVVFDEKGFGSFRVIVASAHDRKVFFDRS